MNERGALPSPASLPAAESGAEAAHLELLRLLEQHPEYSQRQMASALGVSVGKTHYLLKALLAKGWVKAQIFQRHPGRLAYALTPSGITHRLQLTQRFLVRKEQEYLALRAEIASLKNEISARAGVDADHGREAR